MASPSSAFVAFCKPFASPGSGPAAPPGGLTASPLLGFLFVPSSVTARCGRSLSSSSGSLTSASPNGGSTCGTRSACPTGCGGGSGRGPGRAAAGSCSPRIRLPPTLAASSSCLSSSSSPLVAPMGVASWTVSSPRSSGSIGSGFPGTPGARRAGGAAAGPGVNSTSSSEPSPVSVTLGSRCLSGPAAFTPAGLALRSDRLSSEPFSWLVSFSSSARTAPLSKAGMTGSLL